MIELLKSGDAYLYGEPEIYTLFIDFTIVSVENVDGIIVRNISSISFKLSPIMSDISQTTYRFKCKHGKNIDYTNINKLPSEGWEELIECWSCHNNEFKTMLDLNIRPRQQGILISDLYLLLNDKDMPLCCRSNDSSIRKVFMNEIDVEGYSKQFFLYKFLLNHFKMNSLFFYSYDNKVYEMNFFYNCTVYLVKNNVLCGFKAIKVGIKETEKKMVIKENINEYFSDLITKEFLSIGLQIFEYDIGFILENNDS